MLSTGAGAAVATAASIAIVIVIAITAAAVDAIIVVSGWSNFIPPTLVLARGVVSRAVMRATASATVIAMRRCLRELPGCHGCKYLKVWLTLTFVASNSEKTVGRTLRGTLPSVTF